MKNELNISKLVEILQGFKPNDKETIPLHEPLFAGNEWEYVKDCIDTGWVSSVGQYVERFEQMLMDYTGAKHVIAVVNGTAALHVCLKLAGVRHDDEVLIPALTFIATANAVTYCGAIPHLVDSEIRTLGLDPIKLDDYLKDISVFKGEECFNKKTGRRIRAVVPMHTFGHPVDIDPLQEVCERYKIVLVEDAAESLGSFYKGKHTGTFGLVSALSFNGNKIVTTGGGGAILTNDDDLAKFAKHITTTAKRPHKWEYYHDDIGFNYRLPNLNAALGCAQLEKLPEFIIRKRKLAAKYQQVLSGVSGFSIFVEPTFAKSNYWLNVLNINKDDIKIRDIILEKTNEVGICTRPAWSLIHNIESYNSVPTSNLEVAESLAKRIINLPSSVFL